MMNRIILILVLTSVFMCASFPSGVCATGEPIDGVDVKLGKNPGGSIVQTARTGKDGIARFLNLPKGEYLLQILPSESNNYNSAKSTTTRSLTPEGGTEFTVTITWMKTGPRIPFTPVKIAIPEPRAKTVPLANITIFLNTAVTSR